MRDPERIGRIATKVAAVWQLKPDWRLGQLIENAQDTTETGEFLRTNQPVFFADDERVEKGLDGLLLKYRGN